MILLNSKNLAKEKMQFCMAQEGQAKENSRKAFNCVGDIK
jgi:hypothetical protein